MNFRTIQLTNTNIGAVVENGLMPLGNITRKVCCNSTGTKTFDVSTSGANTISLNEKGYYTIVYNASIVGTGNATLSLIVNGNSVYSVTQTLTADATSNITIPYEVRVFENCASIQTNNPMSIQVKLTGTAITNGTSNIIVTRVY